MVRLIASFGTLLLMIGPLGARAAEHALGPVDFYAALAAARPGDTLKLSPGLYRGPFTITVRALKLVGQEGVIIDGGGEGSALTLAADRIEVSDLTVRNSGGDLSKDDAVILLRDARGITVEGCRIEARAFGIYLRGGGRHRIANNEVDGDRSIPRSQRGNGIHLWHTEENQLVENRVSDVRDGFYFSFAHRNLIRGNQATGVRYGIHYMYSEQNKLIGNRLERCKGGVALMFSMRNTIEANKVIGNQTFGILCLDLELSRVERNLIARNGRGFFLENSSRNHFVGNRLEENGVGAFVTAGSEKNTFTANDFDGNFVQAYIDHAGMNAWSENGRGNAWSDYPGFDWNGDGVGEIPYRLQTATSILMARRPVARWFIMSPALALLDWWQGRFVESDQSFLDPAPLVRPLAGR